MGCSLHKTSQCWSWPKSITGFSDKNELPLAIEVDKSHQFPLFQSSPRASLVAQLVKNLRAMRETWVRSLGWEDPLEKGKASHSSILDSSPEFQGLYSPWGHKESDTTGRFALSLYFANLPQLDGLLQ